MGNAETLWRRIFAIELQAPGICVEAAGSDQLNAIGGFTSKYREFGACVRARRQPGSNFQDALKTMEVAEKILAGHFSRKLPTSLEPIP